MRGLQTKVIESLTAPQREHVAATIGKRDLEQGLTRLRKLLSLLGDEEEFSGIKRKTVAELHDAMVAAIIPALDTSKAKNEPFVKLGLWAQRNTYHLPIELFTTNYDLLIEGGLEANGVPYFDGFVGNIRARFRPDLVEATNPGTSGALPASFVRLWKLHGSVNWFMDELDASKTIVRMGVPSAPSAAAAIYPSDEKYDHSRRVPFVVLMDRFRRALSEPETITLICGYSFGDQHLNEIIFDAVRHHPRSETVVVCRSKMGDDLAAHATTLRNLTILAAEEAIIGGERLPWRTGPAISGVWSGERFLLGDFVALSDFLVGKAVA